MALRQFCELIPQTFYTVRTSCHKFPYTPHLANHRVLALVQRNQLAIHFFIVIIQFITFQ